MCWPPTSVNRQIRLRSFPTLTCSLPARMAPADRVAEPFASRAAIAHGLGAAGVAAAGLVGRNEDVGPKQRGRPHILDEIVVPADQDSEPHAPARLEDGVAITTMDVLMLKGVELAMRMHGAVRLAHLVAVEEPTVVAALDQPNADRHPERARKARHRLHGWPLGYTLSQHLEVIPVKITHMPIAGDAHLRKDQDLHALRCRLPGKGLDDGKVVSLVIRVVAKLDTAAAKTRHSLCS